MGVRFLKGLAIVAVLGVFVAPSVSSAETMDNLVRQGFKVSKLTNSKSGRLGWNVTKGDKTYFCPIGFASAYIDDKKMYGFSSSGRPISMDRKVYDSHIGGPDPNIPYWKDIKAGRLRPQDVDPCRRTP
ncbi:hypothetical protein [Pleomorphomonas sp. JP5]|uniref:hypothetical protein n=1 Tax=Pleomorphomonas sp. JP5 TaxID=2942998 RepID=UPI002042E5F8|nr:hypothetical protein [Pleomorphomonas sp. JP5]MCM5556993.1 hypothetical protein [Pleomorphomonas sp. JP5]